MIGLLHKYPLHYKQITKAFLIVVEVWLDTYSSFRQQKIGFLLKNAKDNIMQINKLIWYYFSNN